MQRLLMDGGYDKVTTNMIKAFVVRYENDKRF